MKSSNAIVTLIVLVLTVASAQGQDYNQKDTKARYLTNGEKKKVDYKTFFSQPAVKAGTDEETRKWLTDHGYTITTAKLAGLSGKTSWNELVLGEVSHIKFLDEAPVAVKAGAKPYLLRCRVKIAGVWLFRPNRQNPDEEEATEIEEETTPVTPQTHIQTNTRTTIVTSPPVQPTQPPCPFCPVSDVTKTWATKMERVFGDPIGKAISAGGSAGLSAAVSTSGNRWSAAWKGAVIGAGASTIWNILDPNHNRAKIKITFFDDHDTPRVVEKEIKRGETLHVEQITVKWEKKEWGGEQIVFTNSDPKCQIYRDDIHRKLHLAIVPYVDRSSNTVTTDRTRLVKESQVNQRDKLETRGPVDRVVAPQRSPVTGIIPPAIVVVRDIDPNTRLGSGSRRITF